jgi:amino acid permease
MICSAIITTICVLKLVKVGLYLNTFSYGQVMEQAFGINGRIILELMIALTQFSFSISQISFMARSLKTTIDSTFTVSSSISIYGVILACIMSPVAWVRNFAKFSFSYMIGNFLTLFTVLLLSI